MTAARPGLVHNPGIAAKENAPRSADAFTRKGYEHLDRLITYPYSHNLSGSAQPILMSERQTGNNRLPTGRTMEQTS